MLPSDTVPGLAPDIETFRDIARLLEIMAALRTPGSGCPWDLEQNFPPSPPTRSRKPTRWPTPSRAAISTTCKDELGDLLLQVVFHARMAEEQGAFDFGDVVEAITAKMIRRHPHVFGDAEGRRAEARQRPVGAHQGRGKAERGEAAPGGALAGVPVALPALTRALKLQDKAGRVGFDWNDPRAVLAKIREEAAEIEAELEAPTADRGRGRRSPVRRRQPRPPPRRRSGRHPARHQRQVRAPLRRHRAGSGRAGKRRQRRHAEEMDALWDEAKAAEKAGI